MDHANLGASSAKRWMNCTASPALIATIPDILQSRSSIFAEEGSAAHALAEHVVRSWCEFRMGTDEHAKHPLCIDWTGQVIAKPADPELEQLTGMQKQLLRMGPDNIRRIKEQARALRAGLLGRQ